MTKNPKDTFNIMTELVLPNDTNNLNNLMGGRLMHWMDIAAALAAMKHCQGQVVTASVDNISFTNPIKMGNVVTIKSFVTRSFNTSMEVKLEVIAEDIATQYKYESNSAFFTFVSLDPNGKPKKVPELIPETPVEIELFEGALRRRQLRLILANRLKPNDATELKSLFFDK